VSNYTQLLRYASIVKLLNTVCCRKSKKRKKEKDEAGSSKKPKVVVDEDAVEHGGWWAAKTAADITGTVSIEFSDRCYLKAMDNG